MKGNFEQCFAWLMVDEGVKYTNDPADSGGPTKFGITIKDYRMYINANGTPSDVASMTMQQAKDIYKGKYWDAIKADDLPSGVDNACFNYGVLAGVGRPRANIKRFADITDVHKKIDAMCDEMKTFLNNLATRRPKDEKFRKGWNNRVARLRKNSHELAGKKPDKVTPPAGTVIIGGGIMYSLWNYIVAHPYLSAIAGIALAGLTYWVIDYIRNRNVKSN